MTIEPPGAHALSKFEFHSLPLRVVTLDGEPWFVATDVCSALGHNNVSMALKRLDEDERKSLKNNSLNISEGLINQALNENQDVNIISESGMYSLVLTSRKPDAKRFKKWVTSEVLPAIRKTGAYGVPTIDPANLSRLQLIEMALQAEQEKQRLEHQVEELQPKAECFDRIAVLADDPDESLTLTEAAKVLEVPPRQLIKHMAGLKLIYRRSIHSRWLPYQKALDRGFLTHKFTVYRDEDQIERLSAQARLTPNGMAYLSERLST